MMSIFRLIKIAFLLAKAFLIVRFRFCQLPLNHRACYQQDWANSVLHALGIQVICATQPPNWNQYERPVLIMSNHVSWLDILVLQTIMPCDFVAKREVQRWPLIGTIAHRCGTVFVDRESLKGVRFMINSVVLKLSNGVTVAAFPEGTSSNGLSVYPFHSNLFEAAITQSVPVFPVAIRYVDPDHRQISTSVVFDGDVSFIISLLRVSRQCATQAQVHLLPLLEPKGHSRRSLAKETHRLISQALIQ